MKFAILIGRKIILSELEIDHIEYPVAQKGIRFDLDAKSVRLAVYVKEGKGTVYDIEMKVTDTKELPKRTGLWVMWQERNNDCTENSGKV